MVLSASPCSLARSSLEEMLDSLRRRDEEEEKKKDAPPALPPRPTSRARLPPARRSLPNDFKVSGSERRVVLENGVATNEESEVKEMDLGQKRRKCGFGSKRLKKDVESPYVAISSSDSSGKVWELDGDDSISYFIRKKLRVWCRQPRGQWELGMVQSTSGEEAFVSLSNGNVMKVNRSEILPANPDVLENVDDLIKLCYLNEPSVLHSLKLRYSQGMIYSKAGPILIALNPFKDLQMYGNKYVSACSQRTMNGPHVYATVDAAYNKMMRDEVNQSIIISWFIFMAVFVISKTHMLTGTVLLEKQSRVVQLARDERSYHIFYQLCAGSSADLKEKLNLRAVSEYKYLVQSDCMSIDGVDDAKNFDQLMEALDAVRVCKEDQELIFKILAALLWLGNISFQVDRENHIEVVEDEAVNSAAQLMGCSSQDLMTALCTHKIQADEDTIAKNLTLKQAIERRDAIVKFIYASLFDWLLDQVNKSLEVGKKCTWKSISILDLYGFQTFQKNGFEQFYINYANERIQQHYNRHLFKLEQEDYELDGIDWTKVDFEDNQGCLDLFEKKPQGLLSLLDEESNLPNASDLTFANKLKHHLHPNPCFKGERGRAFRIRHYAGEVLYDTNDFLEKNRDTMSSDCIQFLSSCNSELLQLFSKMFNQSQKQSVATKFKVQLFKLIHQLESTMPHFIRCIAPNTKQLPDIYDEGVVLRQLRCYGVPEILRLSRAGYPTRMTHQEFSRRYVFMLSEANVSHDPLSISVAVLQKFNIPSEMYHVGYTKLYLRAGQIDALENMRKQILQGIIGIQKCFRGHQARGCFCELKNGVTTLQSCTAIIRGENSRRKYGAMSKSSITIYSRKLEEIHAIIRLQSVIRGWRVRKDASHVNRLKKYPENAKPRRKSFMKIIPEVQEEATRANEAQWSSKEDGLDCYGYQRKRVLCDSEKRHTIVATEDGVGRGEGWVVRWREVREECPFCRLKDLSKEPVQNLLSALAELQRQVDKADAVVEQKEEEYIELREQLKQSERKRIEYETKMKSMEEAWQKQMASLQMSLVAARKSLASENATVQPVRHDFVLPRGYDSEDTSMGSRTPGGSTPMLSGNLSITDAGRQVNGNLTTISNLMKEFEQRTQDFDGEVKAMHDVKPGQCANTNSVEELRKLKQRFEGWKKQYKIRLRDTKARLYKSESEKSWRAWWKLGSRA
ncbi:Myosin-2 protein [Vigna angularis]|uniref:Myosin-2 protein n=1 Tax=Phaseolus angularis TaxID=3914 RepID=A0A8T0KBJ5_PHAAN|nr:Myosin-2 protein [Vigna angularis]